MADSNRCQGNNHVGETQELVAQQVESFCISYFAAFSAREDSVMLAEAAVLVVSLFFFQLVICRTYLRE